MWWEKLPDYEKYEFCSDIGHAILDLLGLIPGLGAVPDAINAAWYLGEWLGGMDRETDFWLSVGALIPFTDIDKKTEKESLKEYLEEHEDEKSGSWRCTLYSCGVRNAYRAYSLMAS